MEEEREKGGKNLKATKWVTNKSLRCMCKRETLSVSDVVIYYNIKCLKYLMMISQTSSIVFFFFLFFFLFTFFFFFPPLIAIYANDMQCYGCPIWYISTERRIMAAAKRQIISAKEAEMFTRKTKWEESTQRAQLSIICCQSDWQMFKLSPQMCDWLIFYVVDIIMGCQHHLAASLRGNFTL